MRTNFEFRSFQSLVSCQPGSLTETNGSPSGTPKSRRAVMANISSSGLRRRDQMVMEVPGVNPWASHFLRIPELRGAGFVSRREEVVVCEVCAQSYRPALFAGSFWPEPACQYSLK